MADNGTSNDSAAGRPVFRIPTRDEVEKRQKEREAAAKAASGAHFQAGGPVQPPAGGPATESGSIWGRIAGAGSGSRPGGSTTAEGAQIERGSTTPVLGSKSLGPSSNSTALASTAANTEALRRPPNAPSSTTPVLPRAHDSSRFNAPAGGSRPPSRSTTPSVSNAANTSLSRSILVNKNQRGNKVLTCIKNVPWEFSDILADYQVGTTACALFLSLKYHRLHPEYVYTRIKQIQNAYLLRVLLCLVDIDDHSSSLRDLTRMGAFNNMTLILAWTPEEAGRYLETLKAYEHKPPDLIQEKIDPDYVSRLTDAVTQVKTVNRTDVLTLAATFGSLKNMMHATPEELAQLPGFGEQKVRRLHEAFRQPFLLSRGQSRSS